MLKRHALFGGERYVEWDDIMRNHGELSGFDKADLGDRIVPKDEEREATAPDPKGGGSLTK